MSNPSFHSRRFLGRELDGRPRYGRWGRPRRGHGNENDDQSQYFGDGGEDQADYPSVRTAGPTEPIRGRQFLRHTRCSRPTDGHCLNAHVYGGELKPKRGSTAVRGKRGTMSAQTPPSPPTGRREPPP